MLTNKFTIESLYNIFPLKVSSIELEPNKFLNPKFEFFYFRQNNQDIHAIHQKLKKDSDDFERDIKDQISEVTYYMDFFDYVHLLKVDSLKYHQQLLHQSKLTNPSQAEIAEELE